MVTLLLALLGVYPQYNAIKTVLMGRGLVRGDWEKEHEINQKTLYVIEPVIESLLQVPNQKFSMLVKIHKSQTFVQSVILFMVIGPGETSQNGEFF